MSKEKLLRVLKPGDKLLWVVGMPGPDTDDMEVLEIKDGKVRIKFQVYGRGDFYEEWIHPESIRWLRDSDFAKRYHFA